MVEEKPATDVPVDVPKEVPPPILIDSKEKKFKNKKLTMIRNIANWAENQGFGFPMKMRNNVFQALPFLYLPKEGYQYIDWNEYKVKKGEKEICAERGLYNPETGELEVGQKCVKGTRVIFTYNQVKEPQNDKPLILEGQFKNGMLNGYGRMFGDGWTYNEGKFEDNKLVEGELAIKADSEFDEMMVFIVEEIVKIQMIFYPKKEEMILKLKNGEDDYYLKYNQGQLTEVKVNNQDKTDDEHCEFELKIKELIEEEPKYARFMKWLVSGKDIRDFLGCHPDPVQVLNPIKNKYKVIKTLQHLKVYQVKNIADQNEKRDLLMIWFDNEVTFKTARQYHTDYADDRQIMIDNGEIETKGVLRRKFFYIVTTKELTLKEFIEQQEDFSLFDRLQICKKLFHEYSDMKVRSFLFNNFSPENIRVNRSRSFFYFINPTDIVKQEEIKTLTEKKKEGNPNPNNKIWHRYELRFFSPGATRDAIRNEYQKQFWSKSRMMKEQMEASDDLESLFYIALWTINDFEKPEFKIDFSNLSFKGKMQIENLCGIDIHMIFLELQNQIKSFNENRLYYRQKMMDVIEQEKLKLAITQKEFTWLLTNNQEQEELQEINIKNDKFSPRTSIKRRQTKKSNQLDIMKSRVVEIPKEENQFSKQNFLKNIPLNSFQISSQLMRKIKEQEKIFVEQMNEENSDFVTFNSICEESMEWIQMQENLFNQLMTEISESEHQNQKLLMRCDDSIQHSEGSSNDEDLDEVKHKLFGYMNVQQVPQKETVKGERKSTMCFRCKREIDEQKAWKGDSQNFLCFDCHPQNNFFIDALNDEIKTFKMNKDNYPVYHSQDFTRTTSVLNRIGNKMLYNGEYHDHIYSNIILPDELLKRNLKLKNYDLLKTEIFHEQWTRHNSNANSQNFLGLKNVAIQFLYDIDKLFPSSINIFKVMYFDHENHEILSLYIKEEYFNEKRDPTNPIKPIIHYNQEDKTLEFGDVHDTSNSVLLKIQQFNGQKLNFLKIVPSSNIYTNNEQHMQQYTLCFKSNERVTQTFDIELRWKTDMTPLSINVTNIKLYAGFVTKDILSNIHDNKINGVNLQIQDDKLHWIKIKKTLPHEFCFKNNLLYARYSQFDEKIIFEAQITDLLSEQMQNAKNHIIIMMSGIRTMYNMIPGKVNLTEKSEIDKINWLQPIECLGGRSLSQFFIGTKNIGQKLMKDVLEKNFRLTLATIVGKYSAAMKDYFETSPHDMNFDLTFRTAVHDCMDFTNIDLAQEYRKALVDFLDETQQSSRVNAQVFFGLFGLALEQEEPIPEIESFLADSGNALNTPAFQEIKRSDKPEDNLPINMIDNYKLKTISQQSKLYILDEEQRKLAKKALNDKIEDQGSNRVSHFISDWTQAFIQSKVQKILNSQDMKLNEAHIRHQDRELQFYIFREKEGFNNMFDISKLTSRMNQIYGYDIENQSCIKKFIDSQFIKTRNMINIFFSIYFFLFALPFIIQMFQTSTFEIQILNISCMFCQVFLIGIEGIQINYNNGWKEYIQDKWNYFDISHALVYCIYFYVRQVHPSEMSIIPYKEHSQHHMVFWVFINTAMLVLITFKLMFFMRVSENFASLVKLVANVLSQIGPFTIFFFMWLFTLTMIYKVSGIDPVNEDDYKHIGPITKAMIQNFRNSIGDINVPSNDIWFDKSTESDKDHQTHSFTSTQSIMVYWGWFIFLFNEFFNLIILLNFLIAIISQSYEEVMGQEQMNRYQSRCDLNQEIAILLDFINERQKNKGDAQNVNNTIFYMAATDERDDRGDQFQGFVKTIQQTIKRENKQMKEDISKQTKDNLLELKETTSQTQNEISQFRKEIDDKFEIMFGQKITGQEGVSVDEIANEIVSIDQLQDQLREITFYINDNQTKTGKISEEQFKKIQEIDNHVLEKIETVKKEMEEQQKKSGENIKNIEENLSNTLTNKFEESKSMSVNLEKQITEIKEEFKNHKEMKDHLSNLMKEETSLSKSSNEEKLSQVQKILQDQIETKLTGIQTEMNEKVDNVRAQVVEMKTQISEQSEQVNSKLLDMSKVIEGFQEKMSKMDQLEQSQNSNSEMLQKILELCQKKNENGQADE